MGKYDIDSSALDELLDTSQEEDIANLLYPIFELIKDQIPEIDNDFRYSLVNEVLSGCLLMQQRLGDIIKIMTKLLEINHKNAIEVNTGNKIDIQEHKQIINDIINKYNSKELAKLYYDSLKLTAEDKSYEDLQDDFAEIDELFK